MPRFSNTKDTPIKFRKKRSQAGTRYRESGLVHRHIAVVDIKNLVWEYTENKERHITIFMPAT